MERGPMAHLVTVSSAFEARVLAARLGAEGVLVELRGASLDNVYPLPGEVDVFVPTEELPTARAVLDVEAD